MLYQPYPSNWPQYTPRDKIADWMEIYASVQDLVVWTSTELKTQPVWDADNKRWNVTVVRNGTPVVIQPAHIVMATGRLGRAYVPAVHGLEQFLGPTYHSQDYQGGAAFKGKHVVVVGAGNSASDICQDLVVQGAGSVTMLQRSATCVQSRDHVNEAIRAMFPESVPTEICDFKAGSMPVGLLKKLAIATQDQEWAAQEELSALLRKGGLRLTLGPEGQGLMILVYERFGGTSS